MSSEISITLKNKTCLLLGEKAMFFPEQKIIVISDLHIGKIAYFRKKGIPLPQEGLLTSIHSMSALIQKWQPKKVVYLGDLFHTNDESVWFSFSNEIQQIKKNAEVHLIQGNHDTFPNNKYTNIGISVSDNWLLDDIYFTHEPVEIPDKEMYNIAGHIHPAIIMRGKGKSSVKLPCFKIGIQQAILPAYGHFTGTKTIKPKKDDKIFGVAGNQIVRVF